MAYGLDPADNGLMLIPCIAERIGYSPRYITSLVKKDEIPFINAHIGVGEPLYLTTVVAALSGIESYNRLRRVERESRRLY